ncbi:checkpoint protein Hus1/Mec3 [Cantharellus anzutake]|uniref:checkpoint protein Hus1/Mec3 n=1 Tax=Cantharellus anzutake TaxID=1750568 RepID=UPI0019068353|nr:checkpoint protein Hus1/Mec3 [Cantharellus anzutake]KAF8339769.1 checkpoint protein Hus1/Mec3 [Cantharellus anzutake]
MRFRAKIEHVLNYSRIVQTVEKIAKQCVMRWSPEELQIICEGGDNEGGVQIWSKFRVASLFTDYRIQSNSENMIHMQISTEPFVQALRSAQSSPDVVIKLAKRDELAVLRFDFQAVSHQGKNIQVIHDVRVHVMRQEEIARLEEPQCPEPDVHIILPPLTKLRTVTEHMRPLSSLMGVSATRSGRFSLRIQTDEVSVETDWTGCETPRAPYSEQAEREDVDPDEWYRAIVSVKSFLQFLSSYVVSTTTVASICHNHCVIMYVYIGDHRDPHGGGGVLTFYIPARIP